MTSYVVPESFSSRHCISEILLSMHHGLGQSGEQALLTAFSSSGFPTILRGDARKGRELLCLSFWPKADNLARAKLPWSFAGVGNSPQPCGESAGEAFQTEAVRAHEWKLFLALHVAGRRSTRKNAGTKV